MKTLLHAGLRTAFQVSVLMAFVSISGVATAVGQDTHLATPWITEHATSVRLIGGAVPGQGEAETVAGIEIKLDPSWKTYWRNPGSSGVPPRVEWTGSVNLAKAEVLFPAPQRFPDKEGDTIGYKTSVILPVKVSRIDPAKPVELRLALEYGVCRDVCIPAQANLALTLPATGTKVGANDNLIAAVKQVPRPEQARLPNDPVAKSIVIELAGDKPRIRIEADFPGQSDGQDAFLEAPDGLWLPLPKLVGREGSIRRFEVDLTDGADISDLKGRDIRLTLVSSAGQSETVFAFK